MVVMDRWDICRLKFMIISSAQFLNFSQWAKNGESRAGMFSLFFFRFSRFSTTEKIPTALGTQTTVVFESYATG